MGIVKKDLANFELDSGENVRLEHNEGGGYDLHVGCVQIPLSEEEFLKLVDATKEADNRLCKIKGDEYDGQI